MMDKTLAENNKILANVFFHTITNQAHLNTCIALHTYVIELHIIHNLIVQHNRTSGYTLTRARL
jgi:hypothetical protein